ncbi:hypothetical protein BOX15_Mlig017015g1 [Macrostomum lignano]|uniref:Laminin EGF-like domain-containing protein n=1 Tax=Macrostomum lignano TaxID=282301 RepID=A0A267DHX2_9PLAT|nr:hypothetical protein BOX15_Mlig017015g1 [Macrostomum lignano]
MNFPTVVVLLLLPQLLVVGSQSTPPPSAKACRWNLASCQTACGSVRPAVLVQAGAAAASCPECMCSSSSSSSSVRDKDSSSALPGAVADADVSKLSQLASDLSSVLNALADRLLTAQPTATTAAAATTTAPASPHCQWLRGCGLSCREFGYRMESGNGCPLCQCRGSAREACDCRCRRRVSQAAEAAEMACACDCVQEDGATVRETSRFRLNSGGA